MRIRLWRATDANYLREHRPGDVRALIQLLSLSKSSYRSERTDDGAQGEAALRRRLEHRRARTSRVLSRKHTESTIDKPIRCGPSDENIASGTTVDYILSIAAAEVVIAEIALKRVAPSMAYEAASTRRWTASAEDGDRTGDIDVSVAANLSLDSCISFVVNYRPRSITCARRCAGWDGANAIVSDCRIFRRFSRARGWSGASPIAASWRTRSLGRAKP